MNKPKISIQGKTKVLLLCFLIAITFWFFHAMNTDHTSTIYYPVEARVTSEKVKTKAINSDFLVSIHGNGWGLLSKKLGFGIQSIKVEIPESNDKIKISANTYRGEIFHHLKGYKINYISPDTLYLN